MEVRGAPAAPAVPAAPASYSAGEEMFSTRKTATTMTSRSSKMINYSGSLPTPSKFHKGDICHSDYESDWDASPIPPKWRPSHSDTEDLGFGSMKYRPVKPQLKSGNKSGKPRPQPSPPCPHQWESHDDIARLEMSLREGRRRPVSYSRPASTQPLLPASRCQSTPPVNNVHQTRGGGRCGGGATRSSTATRTTQEVQRSYPSYPASTQLSHLPIRCQSTPPVNSLDTTRSSSITSYNTTTSTTTKSEKREFISVKKRARLLEDIMTTPSPPLAAPSSSPKTSDEMPQELSAPPTERSTPIKPEDIPGAVRVFPMPMMSTTSGSHWKHRDGRSASVDMNGYGGGSLAGSAGARHSPITLPRATKNFRSQTSHHTSHETATTTAKLTTTSNDELMLPPLPLLPTSSSRKFQVAINSTTSHQEDLRLQEEKEKKTTLKQSCNITDDSPPTIELIAYKCSDAGDGSGGDVAGEGSGGSGGGRGSYDETGEGYQISGYEADDDTLNSREMKLFKPSKFVPKLASSASVWKPSTTTTTTIGDAKLS